MDNNTQNPNPAEQPKAPTPEQQQKEKFSRFDRHEYHYHHYGSGFGRFFWGLLIIIVGLMFLARSLGLSTGIAWGPFFSHIWPVLIIFLGLSVMARGGVVSEIVASIIMLVILAVMVVWFFQIPVSGHIGSRTYRLDPNTYNSWMMSHPGSQQ